MVLNCVRKKAKVKAKKLDNYTKLVLPHGIFSGMPGDWLITYQDGSQEICHNDKFLEYFETTQGISA